MKRLQTIFIFLGIISSSLSAQHQLFYSIDGKEWQEEKDRNLYENVLWEEFDLHANYIKKRNLPQTELIESYIPIMNLIREFFIQCRDINSNLKIIIEDINKEAELSKTSIVIDPIRANNNELFYSNDLRTSFNLYLDHFNLISNHTKDIAIYDMGQSDRIPSIDIEKFSENSRNIALAGKNFIKLANDLQKIIDPYKNKTVLNLYVFKLKCTTST